MTVPLVVAMSVVLAQPPPAVEGRDQGKPLPAEICLSNACGDPAKAPPRNAPQVSQAVKAGSYRDVLNNGGTAGDVLAAAKVRCRRNPHLERLRVCGEIQPGSERLELWNGMVTLAWTPADADETQPGSVTRAQLVLTDEAEGDEEEINDVVLAPPPGL